MDEESSDPAKMQLVRIAPASLWIDDSTSSKMKDMIKAGGFDYKTLPNNWGSGYLPEPLRGFQDNQQQNTVKSHYGYDVSIGKWQCCGQRDLESPGCWTDFHSERMPYVRFIGHKEHGDSKGSWPVRGSDEFRFLWSSIEKAVASGEIQAAQDLTMRYFGMQCRLSGYNAGETAYWPVTKEKDQCTPHFQERATEPTATDPALPKRGFADWEKQIPFLDLLQQIVEIEKQNKKVPQTLQTLVNTLGSPNPSPIVVPVPLNPPDYAQIPDLTSDNDEAFEGAIPSMPILTMALWDVLGIQFTDATPDSRELYDSDKPLIQ
jgi:hypothetical protein